MTLLDICVDAVACAMPFKQKPTWRGVPEDIVRRVWSAACRRRAAGLHNPVVSAAHFACMRQFAPCWQPAVLSLGLSDAAGEVLDELAAFHACLQHLELQLSFAAGSNQSLPLAALTQLTCLSLRGCQGLQPAALQQVLLSLPQLTALDLSGLQAASDSLAPALVSLKELLVLQLNHTSCSDATIEWLTYGQRLHSFHCSAAAAAPAGSTAVQPAAGNSWPRTRIRQWHLAYSRCTSRAAELLGSCPDLLFVDLRGSGVRAAELLPLRLRFRLAAPQGAVLSRSAALAAAALTTDVFVCSAPAEHAQPQQHWVQQGVQQLLLARQHCM